MLFQLSQIKRQEALIEHMDQQKQNTYQTLVKSYSQKQKGQKSLQQTFQSVLKQSALLLHILRQIQQCVKHKNLLPTLFNEKDINRLLYNRSGLPDWFEHVFAKEYEKEKNNLQAIGNKIYKLHGLGQKNAQLVKDHWNLQILLKRYESLNEKELQSVDIVQEVESFKTLYTSCKLIYKNFLQMMTKKVLQFLQTTVESTLLYSNQLKKVKSLSNCNIHSNVTHTPTTTLYSPKYFPTPIQTLTSDYRNAQPSIQQNLIINQPNNMFRYQDNYQTNLTIKKNSSTVESLRQKEKANNEFFFRQSRNNEVLSDNSLTREIKPRKSYRTGNYYEDAQVYHENYMRQKRDDSREQSVKSARSYNVEGLGLKRYGSSTNIVNVSNANSALKNSQNRIDQTHKYVQNDRSQKSQKSSRKNHQCLHHCPRHDKSINNHCSKHCNNLCSHEKKFSRDFGIDLPQMDRQYYQSRQKPSSKQLKSARSINDYQQNYPERNQRKPRNERNLAENRDYIRNSHEKHNDYYQYGSPLKENTPLRGNISPYKENSYVSPRLSSCQSQNGSNYLKSRINAPPAVRIPDYFYNC